MGKTKKLNGGWCTSPTQEIAPEKAHMLARNGQSLYGNFPMTTGICFLRFVSYRRAKRDSTASRYVHWQLLRLCQITVDFWIVYGEQCVDIVLVLPIPRMLVDGNQLPLFQLIDPILYGAHGNAKLAAHLLQAWTALTTITCTADQIGIDLECVHTQRHIEDVMLYNILL